MPERHLTDDPTISDVDDVWRRIHPDHVVPDPKREEGYKPSSAAFAQEQLSVNLARDTTVERTLEGYEDHSLVALTAGLARQHGQVVVRDSLPENDAHVLVVGQKSKPICRALSNGSQWIVLKRPEEP
jgi:hypothetical protein